MLTEAAGVANPFVHCLLAVPNGFDVEDDHGKILGSSQYRIGQNPGAATGCALKCRRVRAVAVCMSRDRHIGLSHEGQSLRFERR